MSLLPLVKPRLLQWEGWNGRRCLFLRRLSRLRAQAVLTSEGKDGDFLSSELDLAETGSVKDVGLGQPLGLGPERPHPFPFSGLFASFFLFFSFVLFCTSVEGGTQSGQLFLGFQCTRAKVASRGGFCGSKNHFLKEKRKFKGFSFVLFASEIPEWGFHTPSDGHHREEASG